MKRGIQDLLVVDNNIIDTCHGVAYLFGDESVSFTSEALYPLPSKLLLIYHYLVIIYLCE